jgi:Tfp pilus tip-associated adhesin PilY1/TolA-binding protein
MKNHLNAHRTPHRLLGLALAASLALPLTSLAASISLATQPLATSSTSSVKPNVVFMLDDSGSMAWDYMPDDSKNFAGKYGFNTNQCNGVYYDPATVYKPPVDSTGASYANASFSGAWDNGYATTAGTTDLNTGFTGGSGSGSSGINLTPGPAFYYTYSGTQTSGAQKDFHNTNSTFYKECISTVGSTTAVDGTHPVNTLFSKTTLGTSEVTTITVWPIGSATITVNTASSFRAGGILVNGVDQIMSGRSSSSSTTSTVASNIATMINNCTAAKTGNCTVSGYSATVSGSVITITGPASAGVTLTTSVNSGSWTHTDTAFSASATTAVSSIRVNGVELLLSGTTASSTSGNTLAASVAAGINATGYSATASGTVVTVTGPASAANYQPVITTIPASGGMTLTAGTFPETSPTKLQNFANWYSYYSNRMLMMKTGVGRAFASIDDKYRVGFLTMNNNVNPDIVDVGSFNAAQKSAWYTKLYAATPGNSTPLREALSHVGQLYAHKFGDVTSYTATITVGGSGSTGVDSVQVGGTEIMVGPTTASTSTSTVAGKINTQINLLDPSNYGSTVSGSVVTITGPATALGSVPAVTNDGGGMTFTATAFTAHTTTAQLNGISPKDPVQYSCQQNFVILSTDGYWNGSTTYDLSTPTTTVGNQDGTAPRAMFDGAKANRTTSQVYQTKTQLMQATSQIQQVQQQASQLQSSTTQLQTSTSTLQSQTSQLQKQTSQLQKQTTQLQKTTQRFRKCSANGSPSWGSCTDVAFNCTSGTGDASLPYCRAGTASTAGASTCSVGSTTNPATTACNSVVTSAYAGASSCTVVTSPDSNGYTTQCQTVVTSAFANASSCTATTTPNSSGYTTQCQTIVTSAYADVSSCTATTIPNGSGQTTQCQYSAYSAPTNVNSCTTVAQDTTSPHTVPTATACTYSAPVVANVSSCTPIAQDTTSPYDMTASGGQAVSCAYADGSWTNVNICSAVAKDATSPYDMTASGGISTQCQTVGTSSCASGTTCTTVTTGPTPVASCTQAAASTGNNWTQTTCTTTPVSPKTLVASCACTTTPSCTVNSGTPNYVTTTCDTTSTTATGVSSCSPQAASASNNYTTITCAGATGGTSDTLADVAMYYYQTDLRDGSLYNCVGGTSTDFPSGNPDVCKNNVYVTGADNNVNQHMTTFTLGLGTRGRMVYSSKDYMNDTSGDFYSVKTGALTDLAATPPICSWQSTGTECNWPIPASGSVNNIDDLWHAAVNGRGTYFSATNPTELSDGLSSALSSITARKGSAAAAATSTLNPVAGNNFAYVASYTTVKWTGNLEARSINVTNGVINEAATWCVENLTAGTCIAPSYESVDSSGSSTTHSCVTPNSTAASCPSPSVFTADVDPVTHLTLTTGKCSLLMPVACSGTMPTLVGATTDTRHIYTADSSGTALVDFLYANLTTAQQAYFDAGNIASLSQWPALTSTQRTTAAGANLVNYLRGQYNFDERASNLVGAVDNRIYRYREAVMGDALESQPAFLGKPTFSYADPGYSSFVTAKSSRPGTVYMGANDGMMHAFAADTGIERWAYVPSMVIPNMWKLADQDYDFNHVNFVNGSPTTSDVCVANCSNAATADWRTILVGGLNGGGRGYYALDITDPTAPALLWEFTPTTATKSSPYADDNVGYSFGQPVITKKLDGTWVVLFTSGYNNTGPGDGQGYLFVLNALTGAKISALPTNVGSTITPSGFAKISAWNDQPASNVASYVYGGDVLGNVWRFDINSPAGASNPLLFATLKDPSGVAQPVTTAPVLGLIKSKRVIFVGTGKYLEALDLSNTQVQSEYAIKDDDATATFANPRSHTLLAPKMVNQTLSAVPNTNTRNTTNNSVDFDTDMGWFVDFPDSGERVNIDSKLVQGTLLVPTIVPTNTVCSPGGYGWLNYFNYETGGPVPPTPTSGSAVTNYAASVKYDSTIVGVNIIYIEGAPKVEIVTSADPTPRINDAARISGQAGNFTGKRMLWRELIP